MEEDLFWYEYWREQRMAERMRELVRRDDKITCINR
jgi:hypothetical protein